MYSLSRHALICWILLMLIVHHYGAAQNEPEIMTIHLEGGNTIKGIVLDSLSTEHHLAVDVGADLPLMIDEHLVQAVQSKSKSFKTDEKTEKHHTPRHFFESATQVLLADRYDARSSDEHRLSVGSEFSYGRVLRPWLTTSVGIGINNYDDPVVPVFGQARLYLVETAAAPYVSMQAGYGILANKLFDKDEFESSRGGFVWQLAMGFRFASKGAIRPHLSVGYRAQRVTYAFDFPDGWWLNDETTRITYKSLFARIGLVL